MALRTLFRLAAGALMISGVSLALGMILHPTQPFSVDNIGSAQWAVSHLFWWIGALAGATGLTGLYLRQREGLGMLGFIGSGLAIIGTVLIACSMFFEAFIAPSLANRAPELFESYPAGNGWEGFLIGALASGALFGVGFLILGLTVYRAGVMPRWAIVLAVLGGVPFAVNFLLPHPVAILTAATFAVGLLGLGRGLWADVGRTVSSRAAREHAVTVNAS